MNKFQMDLSKIAGMFDPNKIPLRGNENKIIRVAFDLFRVEGDESDDLWQLQADDDGNEFLVRTYNLPDEEKISEASIWSVLPDKKYANLTISFNGIPIIRLASKDYGAYNINDGKTLQGIVFNKLSYDHEFMIKLFASLPKEKKFALKQAGIVDDVRNWLQSKDIADDIIDKVTGIIEEQYPEEEEKSEEKKEQDASAKDFRPKVPFGNLASEENEQWKIASFNLQIKKIAKKLPAYMGPIEKQTEKNNYFRKVLFTGKNSQLVLMTLKPEEDIGEEIHPNTDQFFRIEEGEGVAVVNGKKKKIGDGDAVLVVAGSQHNIINTSKNKPLKLYTIYSPPHHKDGTVHKTKKDAEMAEAKGQDADDQWKLAFLDLHLKKEAHCGHCGNDSNDSNFEDELGSGSEKDDQDFWDAWWDSGMETYGPGASAYYGELADKAYDYEVAIRDMLEKLPADDYDKCLKKLNDINESGNYVEDLEELYNEMKSKLATEQEANEGTYREAFNNLLESYKSKYNVSSLDELPEKARKEFFNEMDGRWKAENEADVSRLASLGIPRLAKSVCPICGKDADKCNCPECDTCGQPPAKCECQEQKNEDENFDITDVESGSGEWTPEEIELTDKDIEDVSGTTLVNPDQVNKIFEEIKNLAPSDKEALELYLQSS